MNHKPTVPRGLLPALAFLAASAPLLTGQTAAEPVTELEKFIASESAVESSTTLLPNSRPVDSLYGFERSLLETPRSITVITPEAISQRGLTNVYDLAALVPGSTVTNFYGVPGIPTTRGLFSSIYFNGMQRVWNRNGYPTSFGSLESMDYVRGPAPGTYSAASPGGFVNFLPKSPYYDKRRGSLKLTVGEHSELNGQFDIGGPLIAFGKPAAFRVSLTVQDAESFYDGIKNDYISAYASFKAKVSDRISISMGGEYYQHRSNENPGWNRVTQDLIDNGNYIVGSPVNSLTGPSVAITLPSGRVFTFANTSPGFVNRAALETATPFGGTRGNFDGSFLAQQGFASSGFRPGLISSRPDAVALFGYLGAINNPTARTVKLDARRILTDATDFADADTFLYFFDTAFTPSPNFKLTNKFFIDGYTREKVSTYGYGELGENTTLENKILIEQRFDVLKGVNVAYGVSARYEDSLAKTEFTVEPFNRRDISVPPTANDRLLSGGQRDSAGKNYWDPFGSVESEQLTVGVFLTPEVKVSDSLSVIFSARWDNSSWSRAVPRDLGAEFNSGPRPGGGISYTNFSVSPVFRLSPTLTTYATVQQGTSFQGFYVSGSVDRGDTNFQESTLAEWGLKTSALDNKLYAGVSLFYQELVNFDQRGGAAVPQRGRGLEFEATYQVTPAFTLAGSLAHQEHHYRTPTIPGGFVPLTAQQIVQYAGIFTADFGGRANPGGTRAGIPDVTGTLFAKYRMANGFGISGGPTYTASVWGNADKTLKLPAFTLWNASIFYTQPTWEIMLSGKNLFDERYFHSYDPFAANAIILPGEPSRYTVSFTYRF
jgi:iron complex outermembrane recepter protein